MVSPLPHQSAAQLCHRAHFNAPGLEGWIIIRRHRPREVHLHCGTRTSATISSLTRRRCRRRRQNREMPASSSTRPPPNRSCAAPPSVKPICCAASSPSSCVAPRGIPARPRAGCEVVDVRLEDAPPAVLRTRESSGARHGTIRTSTRTVACRGHEQTSGWPRAMSDSNGSSWLSLRCRSARTKGRRSLQKSIAILLGRKRGRAAYRVQRRSVVRRHRPLGPDSFREMATRRHLAIDDHRAAQQPRRAGHGETPVQPSCSSPFNARRAPAMPAQAVSRRDRRRQMARRLESRSDKSGGGGRASTARSAVVHSAAATCPQPRFLEQRVALPLMLCSAAGLHSGLMSCGARAC